MVKMEFPALMKFGERRHINEEEIEQYSLGTVPKEQLTSLEEHLLICETCQNRVHDADRYTAAMRIAAEEKRNSIATGTRIFGLRLVPAMVGVAAFAIALAGWEVSRPGSGKPYPVALEATRGEGVLRKAPAGRSLELQLDVATLAAQPSYRVEVVDATGRAVWSGQASAHNSKLTVSTARLRTGYYFIRVYGANGALLREYGLELT